MADDTRLVPTPASADLPTKTILIGGTAIAATYRVVSLSVIHEAHKVPEAKILLLDGDVSKETFEASNADDFLPGKEIEIKAGYHGNEETIFKGIIVKHGIKILQGQSSVLNIVAKHKIYKSTLVRHNKIFVDKKDNEIIEELITEPKDVDSIGVKHDFVLQPFCTDWDFINMRAEANGLFVLPKYDLIMVKQPDFSAEPALNLYYGSSILEFESEIDARNCFSEVKVSGWNVADQEVIESSASNEWNSNGPGNFSANDAAAALNNETLELYAQGISKAEELDAIAKANMLRRHLAKAVGRVQCIGFAKVWPGSIVKLNGVGDRFNGKVFVTGVRHSIREGRWDTDIQFGWKAKSYAEKYNDITSKPSLGGMPAIEGLHIGIVMQLENDPASEYRVLVKLPTIGGSEESLWARVSTLDAGKERGSFFRPELGDEVLVGFVGNDPLQPVVLGCMHSSKNPSPENPTDDNHIKGFYSREKMKWKFDDEHVEMIFETPNGNKITISDDKKGIILEDENGNKITLNENGIEISSAKDIKITATNDIKGDAVNIEAKASANFKAEGTGGAKLSSSGVTEIKGSMVNIN